MSAKVDPELKRLLDREAVVETVTRLFVDTDLRNWQAVAMLFTDAVHFDMTSLAGGEPSVLSGKQIAAGWRDGLAQVECVHHQAGNFLVDLEGDEATVFCYARAIHHTPGAEKPVTTFVGSYDLHLVRQGARWRIDAFRYDSKAVI